MAGNDSNTVLLINCDGADASTTFTDTSIGGSTHTITANGSAQVDTAQKKFGTGSLQADGIDSYLSIPDNADFDTGTGDFTVDAWVRYNSLPTDGNGFVVYDHWADSSNYHNLSLRNNGGTYQFRLRVRLSGAFEVDSTFDAITVTTGTWYHLALVRDSTTFRFFWDGVAKGTIADTVSITGINGSYNIGRYHGNYDYLDGWMDEYRLSTVARWTTGFTPPSEAYSIVPNPIPTMLTRFARPANKVTPFDITW